MTEVHGELSDVSEGLSHPLGRLARSNGQHRSLVTLLRQGDVADASLLMRQHLDETEEILTATVG
jgi:DNA-binding GntR family transcriptional regulator